MATQVIEAKSRWKLLWENANPTSSFAEQTVSLDLQNYDVIMVQFLRDTGGSQLSTNATGFVGEAVGACGFADAVGHLGRRVTIFEADGITFHDAIKFNSYGSATIDNTVMLPYRIFAYG